MRKVTSFVILSGASAFVVCTAQAPAPATPPAIGDQATAAATASVIPTTSAGPEFTSAAPQITFAAPRPAPAMPQSASAARPSASAATQLQQVVVNVNRPVAPGEKRFCRIQPVLGSHIEKKQVCRTKREIQAEQDNAAQLMRNVARPGSVATQSALMQTGMAPNSQSMQAGPGRR